MFPRVRVPKAAMLQGITYKILQSEKIMLQNPAVRDIPTDGANDLPVPTA